MTRAARRTGAAKQPALGLSTGRAGIETRSRWEIRSPWAATPQEMVLNSPMREELRCPTGEEFLAELRETAGRGIQNHKVSSELFRDFQQFHIKNQCRVWRNRAPCSSRSISQFWRNSQLPLASDFHSRDALIPAFNYLSGSERKRKR